jgi:hypothetical protein
MNLQVVIFSKDRPMQLHATLASFILHCQDIRDANIGVLHVSTSQKYANGYKVLQSEFSFLPSLSWICEHDFKRDLIRLVSGVEPASSRSHPLLARGLGASGFEADRFVLFLVDDTLFVRPFSLAAITSALTMHPAALAFSLRLGVNTTFCYSRSSPQRLPRFGSAGDRSLRFRWVFAEADFGYPLEVSSSVFRVDDLMGWLRVLPYSNPNRLEQRLAASRYLFGFCHPDLLCFDRSVAFCAPVNKVQTVLPNRSGQSIPYSSDALHVLFDQGLRIDVQALAAFEPYAAHQEIVFPFAAATSS